MYYGHVSTTSNREDWQETCILTDEDTGELIDISACRITMTLVATTPRDDGYSSYCAQVLTGSTDSGEITLPEDGTFEWSFDAGRMAGLAPGRYHIGVRLSQDDRTVQLIIGTVDVEEGIDTQ